MDGLNNINNPKVSIIIPVYNVKQYLPEALDSVINQTYKNLEIIVVDDGSNDGSEIICEEYAKKDERIKLIHRENGGLSAARNTGLDNVSGEYIAFLDSDDILLPNAIEKSLKAILINDVDIVIFKYVNCRIPKNFKLKKTLKSSPSPIIAGGKYSKQEILKAIANRVINATVWNKLSKQKIWNNLRFPERHVYEDRYIIFKIFNQAKSVYIINEILILYRKRAKSISNTYTIKNIKDIFESWYIFEKYVKDNTPKLFDNKQLKKTQEKILIDLLFHYAKILSMRIPKKYRILKLIRKKIINMSKTLEIENHNIETKIIYYLMLHDSRFLLILFTIFLKLYKILNIIVNNITCS